MVDDYTLRKNGYVDKIGRGGKVLKGVLNGMDATTLKID
jgi:hypothetical protein